MIRSRFQFNAELQPHRISRADAPADRFAERQSIPDRRAERRAHGIFQAVVAPLPQRFAEREHPSLGGPVLPPYGESDAERELDAVVAAVVGAVVAGAARVSFVAGRDFARGVVLDVASSTIDLLMDEIPWRRPHSDCFAGQLHLCEHFAK